jgi:hypothetical protein
MKVLKALTLNFCGCILHAIKDCTEIFHMIDESDIKLFQNKMKAIGRDSMKRADGLNIFANYLHVPELTSCLNSTETCLQLVEYMAFPAVCHYVQASSAKGA